jgi:hypothetical protein
MSAGLGVGRQMLPRAAGPPASTQPAVVPTEEPVARELLDTPLASLVRQLFYSSVVPERTRIFFAAAGNETDVSGLCERTGRTLAEISEGTVALVSGDSTFADRAPIKKRSRGTRSVEFWHSAAIQLTDKLWRVPTGLFQAEFENGGGAGRSELPFDFVILGSTVSASAAPLFCGACDAAVLVLTANQTRKEAALRAKEVLRNWNVELLGAVLDNRTFPIPESIYWLL